MVFYPPSWLPKLPEVPDDVSIPDFMLNDTPGRHPLRDSRNMFTDGLSGKTYTVSQTIERVDHITQGLQKELGWRPETSEWEKIAGVFAVNTIDTIPLSWAVHKLGGICSPANAAYSQFELEHQMRDSGASCIFTCLPLLEMTLGVAKKLGIAKEKVYILEMPTEATDGKTSPKGFKTVSDIVELGKDQPKVAPLKWAKGEGTRRVAFLCYSSGTSGLPKGVMISHRNVIANTMQIGTFDSVYRKKLTDPKAEFSHTENALGLLPMSHIYGLVVICHSSIYQGDSVVVLPRFEMASCMGAIQKFKINSLFIVPPIIIMMVKGRETLAKYDLSSVRTIFTGAAPLGEETAQELQKQYPSWAIRQGYGMTETCTVVCSSSEDDIWIGSCGSLLPGYEGRLVTVEGQEITGYDQPGELLAKSPSVVQGYLNNPKANEETFVDGFCRTGDEAVIRKSANGHEHIFIVDRIKELIKVKGLQVAPAELESHLLSHPAVADCTVIPVPDDAAGEVPKAFVVKSSQAGGLEDNDRIIAREIAKHVESHKARHKWLKGGVEFIDEIPKSPSGKILRRILKDKEKEKRRQAGAKI